jgi:hypothetical protein
MPSKYQPTGRPPGRPPKPQVERQGIKDVRVVMANTTVDRATMPLAAICPDCFPEGWVEGCRQLACPHGTWVKRL